MTETEDRTSFELGASPLAFLLLRREDMVADTSGVELQVLYDVVTSYGLALVVEMIVYGEPLSCQRCLNAMRQSEPIHFIFRVLRLHGSILHDSHTVSRLARIFSYTSINLRLTP